MRSVQLLRDLADAEREREPFRMPEPGRACPRGVCERLARCSEFGVGGTEFERCSVPAAAPPPEAAIAPLAVSVFITNKHILRCE